MRWRNLAVYALILLVLAGFYYYMDVYKKREKEKAELQAKKVFDFSPDAVSSIHIVKGDGKSIKLVKEGDSWVITDPVKTHAEEASVKGLLNVMVDLEADRWIEVKDDKIKEYGLDKPTLVIEATAGKTTYVLSVGNKNPAETHYYARAGKSDRIFLMTAGRWNILNKDVYDLRRKDLVTFQSDDVQAIKVSWNQGTVVEVKKEKDKWLAPQDPDRKIKTGKVENVIDQIRWLRARKFLGEVAEGNEQSALQKYGLDNPEVRVSVLLKGDREIRLAFAKSDAENQKELVAYSSDLGWVVHTDPDVLGELPRSLYDLEDRSLFTWQEETIGRVSWKGKNRSATFTRSEKDKWNVAVDGGEKKELKESWRIRSVFWDLEDLEYDKELKPAPALPEEYAYALRFFDTDGHELAEWIWKDLPPEDNEKEPAEKVITLWVLKDGKVEKAVEVKGSLLGDIVDKIENMLEDKEKAGKEGK